MSNSPNYTDDVPIVIAERYRPPEIRDLPGNVVEFSQRQNNQDFASYDFSLERMILAKTLEWKNLRFREKEERSERIRIKDLERSKRIEEEQKNKLNQVSYPSTEDLNSTDDEEENESEAKPSPPEDTAQPQPSVPNHNNKKFDTILVPTIIQLESTGSSTYVRPGTHKRGPSGNKIDFSCFETVNSNPFDNMILKTMNEMDILAEVLRDSRDPTESGNLDRNNSSESESEKATITPSTTTKTETGQLQENVTGSTDATQSQSVSYPIDYVNYYGNYGNYPGNYYAGTYQQQSQPPHPNYHQSFYHANQNYAPNFNNYSHMNDNSKISHLSSNNNNNNTIISDNTNKNVYNSGTSYFTHQMTSISAANQQQPFVQNQMPAKPNSKSKSVPDLVKELNDELNNCEMRRIRNNSQTLDSQRNGGEKINFLSPKYSPYLFSILDTLTKPDNCTNTSDIEEEISKLSISSQNLVKNITLMGFPIDLVSRCVQKLGPDEKHVSFINLGNEKVEKLNFPTIFLPDN